MFFDTKPLDEIAQDMVRWCIERGCQKLSETEKEYRVQCPNTNCPSREKAEGHKAFDINKDTAKYHCQHCQLSGQGLNGKRGLIATLESGDFSFSAFTGKQNINTEFFKPKEKAEIIMDKNKLPPIAKALSKEAVAYLEKRGISEYVYRDTDMRIFSMPAGAQLSFMKQPLQDTALFFPIRNEEGEVIHVHYKLLHGGYYMSPGTKPIYLTKKTALSEIIVVEGVFDALSVYMVGYRGAALLGSEITSNHDPSVFKDKPVVVMLDNDVDKPKINAIALILVSIAKEVKIAEIPLEINGHESKDPNDVLMIAGADKLTEIIKNAIPYSEQNKTEEPSMESTQDIPNDEIKQEPTQAQDVKIVEVLPDKQKPKKEIGIAFPQEAWRGIFETYRQAQENTTEASDQYHFGIFTTVAGVILGRSCYVWNGRNLYPNFFTVLIGPTRKSRKTTAKSRGENLLADTDPLVIVQRGLATPEGLIGRLQVPDEDDLEGLPEIEQQRAMSVSEHEGYRMLVICNEFASLLKKAKKETGSGLIPTLTDAYDCQDSLDNPTLRRPLSARKPFVSMVALSTKEWLETNLDVDDIHGGFVNRNTLYLWTPTQPLHNPPEPNGFLLNQIKNRLHEIRKAKAGKHEKFSFSNEADAILEKWYLENYYTEYDSEIVDAAVQRIDENIRKLALLYAVLENEPNDTEIKEDQLQAAIAVGKYWEVTAIEIFGKFGASKNVRNDMKLLEVIKEKPRTRRELQQRLGPVLSADEFNKTLGALFKAERLKLMPDPTDDKSKGKKRMIIVIQ